MGAIAESFRWQGEACAKLGSPISARLCAAAADDIDAGGPVAAVVDRWPADLDPKHHVIALRLLGTAHRLVLLGAAPGLAQHYPSVGGAPGADLEAAFIALVEERNGTFVAGLDDQVQTNETGRAALLHPGLSLIAEETGLPVRLLEIGCSAGLNLRLDRFGYDLGGTRFEGTPFLIPEWQGRPAPAVRPDVVSRRGCDVAPLDVVTTDGAARAESFVWPDMVERFERMVAAVAVARAVPATLDAARAGDWVDEHFRPQDGVVTVLVHSVMWQYVPEPEQRTIAATLEARGESATRTAPVAHLAFEPRFRADGSWTFELTARTWPGAERLDLATGHPHGAWVRWRL